MNCDNYIVKTVDTLSSEKFNIPAYEPTIHSVVDMASSETIKYIDLYFIAENIQLKQKEKMKIRMSNGCFSLHYVGNDEWDKHCLKGELHNKYLSQMKTLKDEFDHDEADILLCDLLEELGYTEIVEAYRKLPKWYS